MAYAIEVSKILTQTLRKLTTLNAHQLSGHVANLDFWLAQVNHGTQLIDSYRERFDAMKAAQIAAAKNHGTVEFPTDTDPLERDEYTSFAAPPKPIPHSQLQAARKDLIDAAYGFLIRCHKATLLDEQLVRTAAESIGSSVDPFDLAR